MIKLFASDLDGTLLNKYHNTDEIILGSIKEVNKHNKYFSVATGRHMYKRQREEMGFDGLCYIIAMNGAVIYNPEGEIIYQKTLNKYIVEELITEFPEIMFECCGIDNTYIFADKEAYYKEIDKDRGIFEIEDFINKFIPNPVYDQTLKDIKDKIIFKVNFSIPDDETRHKMKTWLNKHNNEIINAPFDQNYYEITDICVNKAEGVARLAEILGVQEDEIAVYGDGGNDLKMLESFKHSYATENALDIAKKAASETIGSCSMHAVPKHILNTLKEQRQ